MRVNLGDADKMAVEEDCWWEKNYLDLLAHRELLELVKWVYEYCSKKLLSEWHF